MPVHEPIEGGVEPIQEPDQFGGGDVAGPLGEPGDVREEDGRGVITVGDHAVGRVFELLGDAGGQDVGQQRLGTVVFDVHGRLGAVHLAHRVPDGGEDQNAGAGGGEHECRVDGPPRLDAGIGRRHELQADAQRRADHRHRPRQREMAQAEHQNRQ